MPVVKIHLKTTYQRPNVAWCPPSFSVLHATVALFSLLSCFSFSNGLIAATLFSLNVRFISPFTSQSCLFLKPKQFGQFGQSVVSVRTLARIGHWAELINKPESCADRVERTSQFLSHPYTYPLTGIHAHMLWYSPAHIQVSEKAPLKFTKYEIHQETKKTVIGDSRGSSSIHSTTMYWGPPVYQALPGSQSRTDSLPWDLK